MTCVWVRYEKKIKKTKKNGVNEFRRCRQGLVWAVRRERDCDKIRYLTGEGAGL